MLSRPHGLSLRLQLLLTLGGVMALALGTLVLTVSSRAVALAERQAESAAMELARRYAAEIRGDLEESFAVTRTLAHSVDASIRTRTTQRAAVDTLLSLLLHEHPSLLGTWLGFEADAFDGRDAEHRNIPGTDDTGRFFPGWVRGESGRVEPDLASPDHEYEQPGDGDWYLLPKQSRRETVLEPYLYPVNGVDVLMTSLVVPLLRDDAFYGVAGVDISLAQMQERLGGLRPLGTGSVVLVAGNATYVAHPDSAQLGQPSDSVVQRHVRATLAADSALVARTPVDGKECIIVYVPLRVGESDTRWVLAARIPVATVQAQAAGLRRFIMGFGVATLIGLAALILLVVRRITRPIEELSAVAKQIARGDIEQQVTCRAGGEIGELADAFREVVDTIRALTQATDELVRAAGSDDLDHRADTSAFSGAYADLVGGMNRTMEALASLTAESRRQRDEAVTFLEHTRAVLRRAAGGELNVRIDEAYAGGVYGEVARMLNETLLALRALVEEVRASTSTVTTNAEDIASASQVIATVARATRDDARQMAERSQQVGESVRSIAEDARSMSERAHAISTELHQAAELSERAAGHVQATVATVDRLGTSSRSIGDIVQLIDSVARQIDLLSLNASVEAARAGEVGAAFGVVAMEVKQLATRTRAATGNIRTMSAQVQQEISATISAMGDVSGMIGQLQHASTHACAEMERQREATATMARFVAVAAEQSDQVVAVAAHVSAGAVETASGAGRFMEASGQLNGLAGGLQRLLASFTV